MVLRTPPFPATVGRPSRRPDVTVRVAGPAAVGAAVAAVAVLTCVTALAGGGGAPVDLPEGIADPGPVVGWGLPLARLAGLLASALVVGALLVGAGLGPDDPVLRRRARRSACRGATVWALAALVACLLTAADTAGSTLTAGDPADLAGGMVAGPASAHLGVAGLVAGLALACTVAFTRRRVRVLLLLALLASLPVPLVENAGAAGDGGLALHGLAVHVLAASLWTGGLAGLVLLLRGDRAALAVAVPRFSTLALGAYLALVGSGLAAMTASLPLSGDGLSAAWSGGYAGVVVAKACAVALLGGVGIVHRRTLLPRVVAGQPRAFVRLAVVELLVMASGTGLAAALSRTPPPPTLGVDHAGAPGVSVGSVLLGWRPDPVVLAALGTVAWLYVAAVHRAGHGTWPRHRTWCFLSGVTTAALVFCSGVAVQATQLLSVHLGQQLVVLLVVPPLLLLGRPLALSRAVGGPDLPPGVRRLLGAPASGAVATCVVLSVTYHSPVLLLSLRSPGWHLLLLATTLACGLALAWPVLGVVMGRRLAEWAGWTVPVAVALAVLGIQLGAGDRLPAAAWFLELRLG